MTATPSSIPYPILWIPVYVRERSYSRARLSSGPGLSRSPIPYLTKRFNITTPHTYLEQVEDNTWRLRISNLLASHHYAWTVPYENTP